MKSQPIGNKLKKKLPKNLPMREKITIFAKNITLVSD